MRRKDSGQASIFFALFITTMMVLFAFTTNIGMLVHAKINLQNAADSAAYAGAAVQARQLTSVAYLNWEMRRAVKQFLYYYFVKGSNSHACFPFNSKGERVNNGAVRCEPRSPKDRYSFAIFDSRQSGPKYNEGYDTNMLPTVCVIFDEANNYCQKSEISGVPELLGSNSFGAADTIVRTVQNTTRMIIEKKVKDCNQRTIINMKFLVAWLFNLTPLTNLVGTATETQPAFDGEGLDSIGVLPRMALLRARVDNFEEKLNVNLSSEGLNPEINLETINSMNLNRGSKSVDYFERSIQAFLSAYNNLPQVKDNGIFSEVSMAELIPNQPAAAQNPHLKNPPILAKFDDISTVTHVASSIFTGISGAAGINPEDLGGKCTQTRDVREISQFPLGITKDPRVPTFYAVKLKAKARLLFSPFGSDGSVTLTAYSAARPFGSRVGIDLGKKLESLAMTSGRVDKNDALGMKDGNFINLLVSDFDNDSQNNGFVSNGNLGYLRSYDVIADAAEQGAAPIQLTEAERLRLAGAYAPWEVGYYTIPANYDEPQKLGGYSFNPFYDKTRESLFRLEAPVEPINSPGQGLAFIKQRVLEYVAGAANIVGAGDNYGPLQDLALRDDYLRELLGYLNSTQYNKFHPIPDPLLNDVPNALTYAKMFGGENFTVAARPDAQHYQLTSWSTKKLPGTGSSTPPELDPTLKYGRSSYSVRLVSFNSLSENIQTSNDPGHIGEIPSNPLQRLDLGGFGSTLKEDLARIKH